MFVACDCVWMYAYKFPFATGVRVYVLNLASNVARLKNLIH